MPGGAGEGRDAFSLGPFRRGDGGREPAGQQEDHRGQRPARRPRGRLARQARLNVTVPRVVVVGDLIYVMLAKAEGGITLGTDTFVPIRVAAGGPAARGRRRPADAGGGTPLGPAPFAPTRVAAGGSGANAAAWLARSGLETRFVGRVGDDVLGRFLEGGVGGGGGGGWG